MRSNFVSREYDDIYFNADDPESEKQYVFVETNRIAERMQSTGAFVVAELGFGFGLNCALTLHAASKADCRQRLRYFSVEENLPSQTDIRALAGRLKICRQEYDELWLNSPTAAQRQREIALANAVSLHHGDVLEFVNQSTFAADAWYFDGFSPAKNPAMWSAEIFARCFARTKPGGTFSTYTAAGWVRRNIEAAGFVVNKMPGYGAKREMLVGFRPFNDA